MHPARFLVLTAVLSALLLGAIARLNYAVDPFQRYRFAPPDQARFMRVYQRHIAPGLARHVDYDFVITGSSIMENYSLAEVNAVCGARANNLSIAAMSAYEQRRILEVALTARRPARVLMTLDFNSFAPPPEAGSPDVAEPFPEHMYRAPGWRDYRYLLSGTVGAQSLAILAGAPGVKHTTNFDRAWNWSHEVEFSAARALRDIDPGAINRRFRQPPRDLEPMMQSFELNIARLIEAHPRTQFNLVFPPYSIVVWADFAQRGQLDVSLAFKRRVFERLQALPNVRLFDMQWDASITHDLNRYSDIYHFEPAVNRRMLDFVCSGETRYRVDRESLTRNEALLRAQTARVDVRALRARALTASGKASVAVQQK
jgi:hypothetical protein